MKIGITGHQEIANDIKIWLYSEIDNEIKKNSATRLYSCLAIGADQIAAEIAILNEVDLISVIPSKDYVSTFQNSDRTHFEELLHKSIEIIKLPFGVPSEKAFYEAGKTVVSNCDILFAVWNGLPSQGLGGTADVVAFAKKEIKPIIHFNTSNKSKKYINYE